MAMCVLLRLLFRSAARVIDDQLAQNAAFIKSSANPSSTPEKTHHYYCM